MTKFLSDLLNEGQGIDADTLDGYHASDFAFASGSGVPSGCILMWSGTSSDIPSGWTLCDGNNGAPNLTDRFIVGAGNNYSPGDFGGANNVVLTENQLPSHNHYFSAGTNTTGSHSHSYIKPYGNDGDSDFQDIHPEKSTSANTGSSGNHSHSVSGNTNNAGSGDSHENRPPYFALCYIMKL